MGLRRAADLVVVSPRHGGGDPPTWWWGSADLMVGFVERQDGVVRR